MPHHGSSHILSHYQRICHTPSLATGGWWWWWVSSQQMFVNSSIDADQAVQWSCQSAVSGLFSHQRPLSLPAPGYYHQTQPGETAG